MVGVRDENIGGVRDAGLINVLYGTASGLTGSGAQAWSQNTTGATGTSELFDYFGSSLTP